MLNNSAVGSKVLRSVHLVLFVSFAGLTSCSGGSATTNRSPVTTTATTITTITSSIADVQAACAAEPVRGTVYYYCDCGTGSDSGCVAGNDANAGTSASAPRQTVGSAATLYNSLSGTNTIAFCKGGAFDGTAGIHLQNSSCAAGSTCFDLREYASPVFTSSAKPIIYNTSTATSSALIEMDSKIASYGGLRMLNLSLKGAGITEGIWLYSETYAVHDVTMCNNDLDGFTIGFYAGGGAVNNVNVAFKGNNVSNSNTLGFLGAGTNFDLSYNTWEGNGGNLGSNHTLYLSGSSGTMTVIGNHIHGQYGTTCSGTVFSSHGSFDSLLVKNNYVAVDASAVTGPCYGMQLNNNSTTVHPVYFRNTVVSGNTIVNGGNTGLNISSCPGCVIENNIIIQNWAAGVVGLNITYNPYNYWPGRTDDVSNANIVRNNTVWFGPIASSTINTSTGIWTNIEGAGHIISNNTVSSAQTSGALNCYRHDLPLTSYAFINNNHCYNSTGIYNFEYTRGTLAAWQSYTSSYGFDSASITGAPNFVNAASTGAYDFHPNTGSPLIGAGIAAQMSTTDFAGKTRPNHPAIGAFEP